jgi:hypothetical protein
MNTAPMVVMVFAVVLVALLVLRGVVRRYRRFRRIEVAERMVSEAMADGRLNNAPGEALLQHLDGLRRSCARWREG